MSTNDRRIATLAPALQPLAAALIERAPVDLLVTDAFRSFEEQDELYAQGRTKPGPIVTPLRGGQSWHNYGLAFDVAPLDANGKPHWPNDPELWESIGATGEALGLRWGGRFGDRPHFEYHPNLTIAQAQAGARPDVSAVPRVKRAGFGAAVAVAAIVLVAVGLKRAI